MVKTAFLMAVVSAPTLYDSCESADVGRSAVIYAFNACIEKDGYTCIEREEGGWYCYNCFGVDRSECETKTCYDVPVPRKSTGEESGDGAGGSAGAAGAAGAAGG